MSPIHAFLAGTGATRDLLDAAETRDVHAFATARNVEGGLPIDPASLAFWAEAAGRP